MHPFNSSMVQPALRAYSTSDFSSELGHFAALREISFHPVLLFRPLNLELLNG
jgi:hypothetical protein